MKAVLDTNVVLSGLLTAEGVCAQIVDAFLYGNLQICVNEKIVAEYVEVLARPQFRIVPEKAEGLIRRVRYKGQFIARTQSRVTLPDHDDEIFVAVAEAADADYLVTGNLRHFPARFCRGVRIIAPAEFLKLLPR